MAIAQSPDTVAAWAVIVLSQCAAVLGDAFGQRTVRVVHKHSRRRMIMSFVLVSAVQVLVVLGILQLVLPSSITGTVYIHGDPSPCYTQYFEKGCCPMSGPSCSCVVNCTVTANNCTPAPCPSQGPGSMFRSIWQHPFLLVNGVANTVYYFAESMLYREPLGLVLLVVASLSATVFFKPVGAAFNIPDSYIAPGVLILGLIGALLCVIEKVRSVGSVTSPSIQDAHAPSDAALSRGKGVQGGGGKDGDGGGGEMGFVALYESGTGGNTDNFASLASAGSSYLQLVPHRSFDVTAEPRKRTLRRRTCDVCHTIMVAFRIMPAFLVLSLCYCMWFVFMRFFNDLYRVNAWGFNSYDQVTLPFFVFPVMACVSIAPFRGLVETTYDGRKETFVQSFKHAMKELTSSWSNFFTVFAYRGIINARAVVYSYLAIFYDLDVVYVELTLVRVLTSWIGAIILCVCVPAFINTRPEERAQIMSPLNLLLKAAGTVCVTVALLLLSKSS